MMVGNAAAPRWWEQDPARFEQYVDFLAGAGATSTELVLHHGPIDARGARVHVLEPDWRRISRRFQDAGLACHVHVSLDPRFGLARWSRDRDGAEADFLPLLSAAIEIGERQSTPAAFVVHATSSSMNRADDGADHFKRFIQWTDGHLRSSKANVAICPELRPARDSNDARFDRSREGLSTVIDALARPHVGICWDLGHDWENSRCNSAWTPEPQKSFLDVVRHMHLHDVGRDGAMHQPLSTGRTPWPEMLAAAARTEAAAVTLEIRYRYALAAGEPWTVLAASYRRAYETLANSERRSAPQ